MTQAFAYRQRFSIANDPQGSQRLLFLDVLSPATQRLIAAPGLQLDTPEGRKAALRMLLPPCIEQAPQPVRDAPLDADDAHFWQFPAITEKLAWQRHAALPQPEWQPALATPVESYLGLPWATYVDKGQRRGNREAVRTGRPPDLSPWVPESVRLIFGARLRGYRELAAHWGLVWGEDVRIHTVCQHIYWERLLPLLAELGVTDLHLSHCTASAAVAAAAHGIRVHPWHLAAANVVNPERRQGLEPGRDWRQRRWLASFIGAHMAHYRSDVRVRLGQELARTPRDDVLFELGDNWHFNPIVYEGQTLSRALTQEQQSTEQAATQRYNAVLTDSVFSLCPEGAGPNTIRLWESLAVGSIPVVLVGDWVWPVLPRSLGAVSWQDVVIAVTPPELPGLIERLALLRSSQPQALDARQRLDMAVYAASGEQTCFGA